MSGVDSPIRPPGTSPEFPPASQRRREDHRLVTGDGRYVADLAPSHTLHAVFVRSPEAHAVVGEIDTDAAAETPGVVGIFTAVDLDLADIAGDSLALSSPGFERPHLARDRVRYVGEAVAVVVAESPRTATDAAALVWVEFDPLPVVTDATDALRDSTVIHSDAGTNVVERWERGEPLPDSDHALVVDIEVQSPRVAPTAIEPLAILVAPEENGRLTVHVGHQRPHEFKARLSRLLGIDPDSLRVVVPDVGGAFGMKGMMYPEYTVVAALALRLGRPVMWAERRREHLAGGTHGRGMTHRVRLAGRADGRIEQAEIDLLADVGAYPHNGSSVPTFSRYVATGLYDIEEVRITSTSVVTNRAPTGSYRGAGRPEAAYGIERAVDAFARAGGLDPVAVRFTNFIASSALPFTTPTGATYDSGDYAAALAKAVELIDLEAVRLDQADRRRRDHKPLGVGFGAFVERSGGRPDTGEYGRVEVDGRGRATIRTGSTSAGQGHETVWSQVAAVALGLDVDDIQFVAGDTDLVERGTGTSASRSAQIGASAIWRTAQRVRTLAIDLAADLLEADPLDIDIGHGGFSVRGVPGAVVSWADVAGAASGAGIDLVADEWYVPGAQTFPYGVHAAVVEVDLDTGEVDIVRLVAVDDCGTVLNPMLVEGQIQGSLLQGVGQALYEEVRYSPEGQLLTATLMDYALPRASDAPPVLSGRLVHPAPSNTLGAKGTGEAGCIGAPPAIVNATLDALAPYGVTHLEMPLRPHSVWAAIRAAPGTGSAPT